MGFADAYLQKAGLREALIEPEPNPELNIIVTIPVFNESGLERCLDSLFQCNCDGFHAEVLILINAPKDAPVEALEQNKTSPAHWAHMVVHGVLHLRGFDHEDEADAQVMEDKEREVLDGLGFSDPYAAV